MRATTCHCDRFGASRRVGRQLLTYSRTAAEDVPRGRVWKIRCSLYTMDLLGIGLASLKLGAILLTGIAGVGALLVDFRDPTTKRITVWGRRALLVTITSARHRSALRQRQPPDAAQSGLRYLL
jgi:hypothetical protein